MASFYGEKLRKVKKDQRILPFIGIYDVFSASIVANYHDCLFVSGFGFAASHYGLPDIGFNTWTDLLNYVMRIRNILPNTHILVDIDDGFVDIHNAKMITSCLLDAGASGIILEDQARPRRCGHYNGKNLVTAEAYVQKLEAVMKVSQDLFIVARTDASQVDDILERVNKIKQFPVDCILVDGMSVEQLCSFEVLHEFRQDNKIAYNQITGGKSSPHDLNELEECGIGVAIFSTPCLFTAQFAMQKAMHELIANNYLLNKIEDSTTLSECTEVLNNNLLRRFKEDGSN